MEGLTFHYLYPILLCPYFTLPQGCFKKFFPDLCLFIRDPFKLSVRVELLNQIQNSEFRIQRFKFLSLNDLLTYHKFTIKCQFSVFGNIDKIIEIEVMILSQMHTKNLGILRSLEFSKIRIVHLVL